MHAVIAIFAMPRPDSEHPALRGIVDRTSREPGFVTGYWTHDGERAYNMLVFETLEAAEQRAADVRGNTKFQEKAGIVLERVVVSEVIASAAPQATAPTGG